MADVLESTAPFLEIKGQNEDELVDSTQGAQRPFHLPKKYTDSKIWIFWCKTTWGATFTKGVLPLVGESR